MKHLPLVLPMALVLGLGLSATPLYAQADLPLVLQDLDNPASEKISFTENGKVGIGTATPVARLHVMNATGSNNGMFVEAAEGDRAALYYLADQGVVFDSFRPGNGRRLPVLLQPNGGRVGIGTNAPSSLLHVEGDIQAGSTTQTGDIKHYRSGFAQEAGLLSSKTDGGLLHLFDEAGNLHTVLEADNAGAGGFLAVKRSIGPDGFTVDGNNSGTGDTKVTISGTSNMAFDASLTGDLSVQLPSDAVSSTEILNEAGAAQSVDDNNTDLTGGDTVDILESSTITAPSSGYVLVIGSGRIRAIHANGTLDNAGIGVSADCTDGTPTLPPAQDNDFRIPSSAPTGDWYVPFSAQHIFEVSAGSNTFCILAEEFGGTVQTADESLSLVFIPTAYGTVDQSILGGSGAGENGASARQGGLTPAEIASEQAASMAANQARIDRELAQVQALRAELERYLEQVRREQGQEETSGEDR